MPLRKKVRSADSFNVLASWLQQPSHLVGDSQLIENSTGSASLGYLSTAEDLLNADQKSEPGTHLRHDSCISPFSHQTRKEGHRTHRQAHSLSEGISFCRRFTSDALYSFVARLASRSGNAANRVLQGKPSLSRYEMMAGVQLLDTTAPRDSSFVAERYRKSLMECLFGALTTKLPTFLQLRTISQNFGAWMDRCTTESPIILLIALVTGLQFLRFLYISVGLPLIVCVVLGSLGLFILQKSEKKYKASMRKKNDNIATLSVFEGGKHANALSNGARSYRTANPAGKSPSTMPCLQVSRQMRHSFLWPVSNGLQS